MSVKVVLAALSLGVVTCFASDKGDAKMDAKVEKKDSASSAVGAQPHPEGPSTEHNNNTYECAEGCKDKHVHHFKKAHKHDDKKKDEVKKDEVKKDEVKKDEVKKDEVKKDEKKDEAKKDEAKKDEAKKDELKK